SFALLTPDVCPGRIDRISTTCLAFLLIEYISPGSKPNSDSNTYRLSLLSMVPSFTVVSSRLKPKASFSGTVVALSSSTTLFRSEEHTSELQSRFDLVCRLLLEKKNFNFLSCLVCH